MAKIGKAVFVLTLVAIVYGQPLETFDEPEDADRAVCMDELGCFNITDDFFHIVYRPINFLPNDRKVINTKFLLYTSSNSNVAHELKANDEETLLKSPLTKNPLRFIIHGFMDNELFGPWMVHLKDAILLNNDYRDSNVIIVDWSGGNGLPYTQATANTRVVGAEIGLLIRTLQKTHGIGPNDCHLIGHSLGAHIAGYAGKDLDSALNRITALDPAEPYFQFMPTSVRIDQTDAQFVDVIHTDSITMVFFGLGMRQTIGHVDFFPNGGMDQPGCIAAKITSFITSGLIEGIRRFVACNHQRAVDFFTSSISLYTGTQTAYACKTWDDYQEGNCADCGADMTKCAIIGIRAEEYRKYKVDGQTKEMYIKTSGKEPFWIYQYQVTVKLLNHKDSKNQDGKLTFGIHGDKNNFAYSTSAQKFSHGSNYKFLVTSTTDIGELKTVTLEWQSTGSIIDWFKKKELYVHYVQVIPMDVMEKSPRPTDGRLFCKDSNTPLQAKSMIALEQNNDCKKL